MNENKNHPMSQWLSESLQKYNISDYEIIQSFLGCKPKEILSKVIMAPYWDPEFFKEIWPNQKTLVINRVWQISLDKTSFTFIKTGIGAPLFGDIAFLLTLPSVHCEEVLFIGSVGGLVPHLNIGDLVIPTESISGLGFSRYLSPNQLSEKDYFGQISMPDSQITTKLQIAAKSIIQKQNSIQSEKQSQKTELHLGKIFSTDTIVGQFAHIEEFVNMGCIGIEMETAIFFHIMKEAKIPAGALLLVSDNVITKKSLFSGRTKVDKEKKREVKRLLIPEIIKKMYEF
ncbi:phosphorylase family protein [Candidatus Harpocratesius sp.]